MVDRTYEVSASRKNPSKWCLSLFLAPLLLVFVVHYATKIFFRDYVNPPRNGTTSRRQLQIPWLEAYGGTPRPSYFPLQRCQGDCDFDMECDVGLICFQREANQPVPGCRGGETFFARTDFCIPESLVSEGSTNTPTFAPDTQEPTEEPTKMPTVAPTTSQPPTQATSELQGGAVSPPTINPTKQQPLTFAPTSEPPAELVADDGFPSSAFPLQSCQADCDGDFECDWGLYCYARTDPRDPIPGCSIDPTTMGQIWSKDFCLPSNTILPGAFRLRLYWEEGYVWQYSTEESFWCVTSHFNGYPGTGNCWYGEDIQPCTTDHTYLARCDGNGLQASQQAWRFLPVNEVEILIQSAATYDQRCWERYKREVFLNECNPNNEYQRWFANNGTNFFDDANKFEISQLDYDKQCVSNDHHPKPGEVVELHSCRALRKNSSQTALWTMY